MHCMCSHPTQMINCEVELTNYLEGVGSEMGFEKASGNLADVILAEEEKRLNIYFEEDDGIAGP